MQIWYGPYRRPVQLWTCPADVDDQGRVLLYLAGGPVGVPVMASLITKLVYRPLPAFSRIKVITDVDRSGRTVFGAVHHTPN
jgi:hypothetical protein